MVEGVVKILVTIVMDDRSHILYSESKDVISNHYER